MPRPYSEGLRHRVVMNAVANGKTTREVSALFQMSPTFVSIIYRHLLQTGHVHPKQIGGYRRAFLEPYRLNNYQPTLR
jgi:transposase